MNLANDDITNRACQVAPSLTSKVFNWVDDASPEQVSKIVETRQTELDRLLLKLYVCDSINTEATKRKDKDKDKHKDKNTDNDKNDTERSELDFDSQSSLLNKFETFFQFSECHLFETLSDDVLSLIFSFCMIVEKFDSLRFINKQWNDLLTNKLLFYKYNPYLTLNEVNSFSIGSLVDFRCGLGIYHKAKVIGIENVEMEKEIEIENDNKNNNNKNKNNSKNKKWMKTKTARTTRTGRTSRTPTPPEPPTTLEERYNIHHNVSSKRFEDNYTNTQKLNDFDM